MAREIYNKSYYTAYSLEMEILAKVNLSTRNKELIKNFLNYLGSTGSKALRQAKLSSQLRRITLVLNKDLDQFTKYDIQSVVNHFNSSNALSEATKADYRRCIKQFYKWFKDEDSRIYSSDLQIRDKIQQFYKFIEKDMSTSYKVEQINPATIISDEDLAVVVNSCRSIKEIALMKFLHETGVRIAELLNMKLKDVHFNCVSARVTVDGKTGMRNIPITTSVPALSKWLELHPFKNDPETYLWTGDNLRRKNEPLKHSGVVRILSRNFQRVRLNKKCNPHWFRHSRASLLAPNLTEVLLCKYMGWSIGSKQVKTYVHLCSNQLEDAYLKLNGLKIDEAKTSKVMKCGCGVINENNARYCYKCGRPLTIEIAIQDEELVKSETDKTVKFLMEIVQNPELLKKFTEFKLKSEGIKNI